MLTRVTFVFVAEVKYNLKKKLCKPPNSKCILLYTTVENIHLNSNWYMNVGFFCTIKYNPPHPAYRSLYNN